MSKLSIAMLIVWLALAIANIVSLVWVNTVLLILNYAFGFINFWIVVALLPQVYRALKKPKMEDM